MCCCETSFCLLPLLPKFIYCAGMHQVLLCAPHSLDYVFDSRHQTPFPYNSNLQNIQDFVDLLPLKSGQRGGGGSMPAVSAPPVKPAVVFKRRRDVADCCNLYILYNEIPTEIGVRRRKLANRSHGLVFTPATIMARIARSARVRIHTQYTKTRFHTHTNTLSSQTQQ